MKWLILLLAVWLGASWISRTLTGMFNPRSKDDSDIQTDSSDTEPPYDPDTVKDVKYREKDSSKPEED